MSTKSQAVVIARKKGSLKGAYITILVLGLSFILIALVDFIISSILGLIGTITAVFMLIAGITLVIFSVVYLIKISKVPEIIIIYENGELRFPDGSCNITELKKVEYRQAHGRYHLAEWGKIILTLNDRTVEYDYVANVVQVHNVIIQLMLASRVNN